VHIYSEVGQGSTDKLFLRRGTRDAKMQSEIVGAPMPSERGETILVVDDNETLRSVMMLAITELGYRGLDAPHAKAAIEILKSDEPIDLLVTDVGLPNMNGRQLAEIARQQRPGLKMLFVTGYAENAARRGESPRRCGSRHPAAMVAEIFLGNSLNEERRRCDACT
jgi:CheY-like chemotaxis protein